ncbi:homeobox expressed in ES cells 1-A-like [Sinocyclocheilus anshuiensis]|uniref:homeobox expressed in ES cells 1-A-like n=1 Tax=Sinocyclocheilus anshuiensis TaxID=1608454 RepID=UPI0007B7ADAE|nr:PREDICTED: homeobox expressed in ES cells 1-A-like [Sinocyclocheilus anshuiensis]
MKIALRDSVSLEDNRLLLQVGRPHLDPELPAVQGPHAEGRRFSYDTRRRGLDLQMASLIVSAHQNRSMPRQSAFTIDSILGLDRPDQRTVLSAPYRPWTDVKPAGQNRGVVADSDASVDVRVNEDSKSPADAYRRTLNWSIGRRPRTAFSSVQIKILESVFQVNSYPGIDIREELAKKLHLDEDRIQIWFQNRRAKLKRSHRESKFLMVKNVLSDLQTSRDER